MNTARACNHCRAAKVRCDLARPTCNRCERRRLACVYPGSREYVFRDETVAAQRLSRRARGEQGESSAIISVSLDTLPSATSTAEADPPQPLGFESSDLRVYYSWLNDAALAEIPEPVKRDVETRVVERFFVNWTIHPSAVSPGHMHHLPLLYSNSPPESILALAVRAVAYADTRHAVKARRSYGAALAHMRAIAENAQELTNDRVLAALLLIDCYESMYLARSDPLGAHGDALQYIIQARGVDQLHHHSTFCLWRVANWQLQARQVLLGEEPNAVQLDLSNQLNLSRPELLISADVTKISNLCAATKRLLDGAFGEMGDESSENAKRVAEMLASIRALIERIDAWTSAVTGLWKPVTLDAAESIRPTEEMSDEADHPLNHFSCPQTLSYFDASVACIWNFYSACQIVLRESYIDLVFHDARIRRQEEPTSAELAQVDDQKAAIDILSASVVRSMPLLMGFADVAHALGTAPAIHTHGMMVSRYLGLFSMIVIQKAKYTSTQHKATAFKVTEYIWLKHKLS